MINQSKLEDLPLVSVIVTTYFSSKYLSNCLESIKNQTYLNIEVICVDSYSTDGTRDIIKKYTNKYFFDQAFERSAKRNFGVKNALGKFVVVIDSDMVLEPTVIEACVKKIYDSGEYKAIVIPEKSIGRSYWAKCKSLERSFYVGIDWMEAARFFSRETFLAHSGYDENNTGSEDYDLPQRIKHQYGDGSIGRINSYICQDEVDLSIIDSCRKKFYYAESFPKYASSPANRENFKRQSRLFLRYYLFFSQPRKLLKNPCIGFGMLIMKTVEFMSGGIGFFWAKLNR